MAKMKIKTGDTVQVLSGKDKDKRGVVVRALPREGKVVVEGVAVAKKAVRPTQDNQQGGFVNKEMPIDVSNVALIDPKTDKPTRVGYRFEEDGTKVRVAKKSGEVIPDPLQEVEGNGHFGPLYCCLVAGSRAFLAYLHKTWVRDVMKQC